MSRYKTWTEDQFKEAVKVSISKAGVLKQLGLIPAGGGYDTVTKYVKLLNLDTSHWRGQAHMKGKNHGRGKPVPLEHVLVNGRPTKSHQLKLRLIKLGLLTAKCSICQLKDWLDKPISLHLDHINGQKSDNRIENLRLLCPNCHSQTETYCGKNKGKSIW